MDIKDKLARLDPARHHGASPSHQGGTADHSYPLPGSMQSTAEGSYWHIRTELNLAHRHGNFQLGHFFDRDPDKLRFAAQCPALDKLSLRNLLFLDTETTGLAGGAGTMAFLVGVGFFDDDRFVIEQYFVRRFAEERAVLSQFFKRLQGIIHSHGALVSFNGKSYDLPLLHNRAVLHRFSRFPEVTAHIDILYPARRLWKNHLPDCSLKTLERALAGVSRQGDVPAHLIPEIYFRYLRTLDPTPLRGVLYHNQLDIVSMVALLDKMLLLFGEGSAGDPVPVDWLSMGRMVEAVDAGTTSHAFYDRVLRIIRSEDLKKAVFLRKARLYKRQGNYQQAIELWENALRCRGFSPEPYEELAKVYEHHKVDLYKAQTYTERALEEVTLVQQLYPERLQPYLKEGLMLRLRRLKRKQGRGCNGV